MAMIINNNMSAKNTLNSLNKNSKSLEKSLKQASSGMRINGAGDDASGYAISERMRVQILSLEQDDRNTQNGNSMLRVAEGAINSDIEILTTLKEKLLNAANDTCTDKDRAVIQNEFNRMIDQIDDNANIEFNGMTFMDGSHNKQVIEPGTKTCFTNNSLSSEIDENTPLTELKDAAGNSLGILPSDFVTISYVFQGEHRSGTYAVTRFGNTESLQSVMDTMALPPNEARIMISSPTDWIGKDAAGNDVFTPNHKNAITFTAVDPGLNGQISGLTISITNRDGESRRTANTVLDDFVETIRAENPSKDNSIILHTGTKANQSVKIGFSDMRCTALGLKGTDGQPLNISTQKMANAAINVVETALMKVTEQATLIGSVASRLGMTSANLNTARDNVMASESTIRDADMAATMSDYTKHNVLLQASQSMLAQANSNSSQVLSLLQ